MTLPLAALGLLALAAALPGPPAPHGYSIGNGRQRYMKLVNERAIDSHFRISKSSPKTFPGLPLGGRRHTPSFRGGGRSEPPTRLKNLEDHLRHETRNASEPGERTPGLPGPTKTATPAPRPDREEQQKLERKEYFRNNNVYQKPGRIGSGTQNSKVEPNVYEFTNAPTDRRFRPAQSFHRRVRPSSRVKDKILHKGNVNDDRNEQMTVRRLGGIIQQAMDRNSLKEGDYRKRHAVGRAADERRRHAADGGASGRERCAASGGVLGRAGPDGGLARTLGTVGRHSMPARIGDYDVGRAVEDPPYALFYRMNREESTGDERADAAFYSGGVTNYADMSTARESTKFIGGLNHKIKPYSAFRDR